MRVGRREVYGIVRWYSLDPAEREAWRRLTGRQTVEARDADYLAVLGVEVEYTDLAYVPGER